MIDQAKCNEMLEDLLQAFPLHDWDITVKLKTLPNENEESLSGKAIFDDALRRAIIYIDPQYPKEDEYFTLREIIAHELGHIAMRETQDEEYNATLIGNLIISLAEATI